MLNRLKVSSITVLVTGLLSLCSGDRLSAGDDREIFVNEQWGYALAYPGDWTVAVDVSNPSGRPERVVRERMVFRGPEGGTIFVSVWENLSRAGLKEWFGRYLLTSRMDAQTLSRQEKATVAGQAAMIFEVSSTDQAAGEWAVFFGAGDRLLKVVYEVREGDYWPVFQEILESFTILSRGNDETDEID